MNNTGLKLSFAAAALVASMGAVIAQTPTPPQPMAAPHSGMAMPGSSTPGSPPMGSGMGRMMEMMHPMPAGGMSMPFEHIEGRIAYLKAELNVTESQNASWNVFAETMRTNAAAMKAAHDGMGKMAMPTTTPDRMAMHRKMMSERVAMMDRSEPSLKALYAALSAEQRTAFDQLMTGPMGMM